ncbi:MAG: ATP phosphoribosyltransferase, partial [Burkholderiaceae bacterium]|nr:ATP phosphoribosyltransferase [Burkholderiaceae bacterium]
MQSENRLRIALQKSGRLSEGSFDFLQKCGFDLKPAKNRFLVHATELETDFLLVRDDDIPGFLAKGVCDLGIVGHNLLMEHELAGDDDSDQFEMIMPLGFSRCRLSLSAPIDMAYQQLSDLEGVTIATSYPNTLRRFLQDQQIKATIVGMHGSVELAPKIGIADVIC